MTDLGKYRSTRSRGPTCSVGIFLANGDPDKVELFRQIEQLPDVVWAQVEEYSEQDLGVKLSAHTLRRHARGKCACD